MAPSLNNAPQLTVALAPALAAPIAQLAQHLGYETGPDADTSLHLGEGGLILRSPRGEQAFALPVSLPALASALLQLRQQTLHPLPAGWQFDPRQRQCQHPSEGTIPLTDKEALLLAALLAAPDALHREQLIHSIWGHESGVDSHTFDTHLYRLRGKLEPIAGLTIAAGNGAYRLALH